MTRTQLLFLSALVSLPTTGGGWGCGKADPNGASGQAGVMSLDAQSQLGTRRRLKIDVSSALEKAEAALAKGVPHEAVSALYAVVSEVPENIDAHVMLSTAYVAMNQPAKALQQAKEALKLDARSKGAILAQGVALAAMGDLLAAIKVTREVTRRDAYHKGAWLNLAQFHGLAKQWERQEIVLEKLIGLEPDKTAFRVDRARALLRLGHYARAQEVLEGAVERVPHDAQAQLLLAATLYEQGELKAAMDRADIAGRLNPDQDKALDLFRAAFYVAVASALQCRNGDPPWAKDTIDTALESYKRQGIDDVDEFYEIHASYGASPATKARIAKLAQRCRDTQKTPKKLAPSAVVRPPTP